MIEALFVILLVLTFLALVGHGIWVVIAFVLRLIFFRGRSKAARSADCPLCGAKLARPDRCDVCGWQPAERSEKAKVDGLAALARVVAYYRTRGWLTPAAGNEIGSTVARLRQPAADLAEVAIDVELVEEPAGASAISPASLPPSPVRPVRRPIPPVPLVSPAERARRFMARRAEAATAIEQPASAPSSAAPPREPRKPFAAIVAAFMEDKNIRWGELVGGLLIVCCSMALVISFWSKIAERPFVKFFVFNGVVAALFGLGMYAHHRWRLRTTSRGLLLIAVLLVPLNFLALAAFTLDAPPTEALALAGEVASIALFAALVYAAAQILVAPWPIALAGAVIVPSVMQLVVRRFVTPTTPDSLLLALGSIPVVCYLASNFHALWSVRNRAELDEDHSRALATLLGVASFAAAIPLGLAVYRIGHFASAMHAIAPLVSCMGMPALAAGLVIWRRTRGEELFALRLAGTTIALVGALVFPAALVLAWPEPSAMVTVAALDFVLLTAVALWCDFPPAHAIAAPCLVVAWLVGFHAVAGRLAWDTSSAVAVIGAVLSAASARILIAPVALMGLVAAVAGRRGRAMDALIYLAVASAAGAASFGLATWKGFAVAGDPEHVTWVYLALAVFALGAACATGRASAAWLATLLLAATLVEGLAYRFAEKLDLDFPLATAMVAHGGAAMLLAIGMSLARSAKLARPQRAFANSALASTLVASVLLAWAAPMVPAEFEARHLYALAGVWLAAALWLRDPGVFAAFQLAFTVAILATVGVLLAREEWYQAAPIGWLHPWSLQAFGVALGSVSLVWLGLRAIADRASRKLAARAVPDDDASDDTGKVPVESFAVSWPAIVGAFKPSLDIIGAVLVVVLLAAISFYGVAPGIAHELWSTSAPGSPAGLFHIASVPHVAIDGAGGWALVGVALALALAYTVYRPSGDAPVAVLLVVGLGCLVYASGQDAQLATASTLRWLLAFVGLALAIPIWLAERLRPADGRPALGARSRDLAGALLGLYVAPIAAISGYVLAMAISGDRPVGPGAATIFGRLGLPLSYAGPLGISAALVAVSALVVRSERFAFAAGLIAMLAAATASTLSLTPGQPLSLSGLVFVAQSTALVMACFALAWLAATSWAATARAAPDEGTARTSKSLTDYVALMLSALALAIIPPLGQLVLKPRLPIVIQGITDEWTCAAAVLCLGAFAWWAARRDTIARIAAAMVALLVAATLAALISARWDMGNMLAFRTLLVGYGLVAWCPIVAGALARGLVKLRPASAAPLAAAARARLTAPHSLDTLGNWAAGVGCVVILLGLEGLQIPPDRRWGVGAITSVSLLMAVAAVVTLRRRFVYDAAAALTLAILVARLHFRIPHAGYLTEVAWAIVIAGACVTILSVLFERWRAAAVAPPPSLAPPFHRVAAPLLVAATLAIAIVGLAHRYEHRLWHVDAGIAWLGISAAMAALAACLWDRGATTVVAKMYLVGLASVGIALEELEVTGNVLTWAAALLLAAFGLATSYLWSKRDNLMRAAARLGVPPPPENPLVAIDWLAAANVLLMGLVVYLVARVELTSADFRLRLSAAQAAVAEAMAIGLLAHGRHRSLLQPTALLLGVVGAIAFGWAWLDPATSGTLLNRAVVVAVALAAMTVVYGLGLGKLVRENEWTRAARGLAPFLVVLVAVTSIFILAAEALLSARDGTVVMARPAMVAVVLSFLGLAVASIAAALVPGRDPLGLSERGRTVYVYAAEACLGGLFMHLRLTMPWLFAGYFRQFWPLIVVLLAFVGVGLGEVFRRWRRPVLSEPLETTGALLPLLPVMAFWIVPTEVNYSVLLLAVGALYGSASILRKSFAFGVLSAIAANGALWYLLARVDNFSFFEHPQLWLIPPAVCVLAAAYLNRRQMSAAQMTAVRYACSIMIYASSTADIFLTGVRQAPWLPLVLAALSVLGVMAGIMLRVRAFLILGTSFLVVALATMIWHAAVDLEQTWVWSVTGIIAGMAIIAVFAMFEKKRDDVLRVVEELKHWQP